MNIRHIIFNAARSLSIATILIGGTGLFNPVQAQNVNGIFFPRSSEEFFQEGVQRIENDALSLQEATTERSDRPFSISVDNSIPAQREILEQDEERWLLDEKMHQDLTPSSMSMERRYLPSLRLNNQASNGFSYQ
ncbi:MAG: hypothetical protein AAGA75_22210 [Cyanobacteria bacterium P01_E01_bin.6]